MRATVLFFVSVLVAAAAGAQVTARQGVAVEAGPSDSVERFESPMVLEIPYARLAHAPERGVVQITELARYWCEDVRIVSVRFVKAKQSKRETRYDVSGFLQVAESYDRKVDLDFKLMAGDRTVAESSRKGIDAEEEKSTRFDLRLGVTSGWERELEAVGEEAILYVTVTVRDDS